MYRPDNTFYPLKYDTVEDWAFWENALSKSECEDIVKQIQSQGLETALLLHERFDEKVRDSKIKMLFPRDHPELFERITGIVKVLNDKFFNFDLFGIVEGLQFTEYSEPGGHYTCHIDKTYMGLARKLSITIQLTDPEEYDGGDLELFVTDFDKPTKTPRSQGTLIAFPSYTLHRVSPVTKGTRNSLVCWFTGNNFK